MVAFVSPPFWQSLDYCLGMAFLNIDQYIGYDKSISVISVSVKFHGYANHVLEQGVLNIL